MAPATLRHGGGFGWTVGVGSGSCGWRLTVELVCNGARGRRRWIRIPVAVATSAGSGRRCARHLLVVDTGVQANSYRRVAAIASPLDCRHHAREIWWFAGDQPWVAGKSFNSPPEETKATTLTGRFVPTSLACHFDVEVLYFILRGLTCACMDA
nr:hypothetical protein Iba_chr02dCG1220 [Ipomoea batatas]